jgi:acetyltransferase-like isoleucine patch superfamily enzyme
MLKAMVLWIEAIIGRIILTFRKAADYFIRKQITKQFSSVGNGVYVGNGGIFTFNNIEIGDDVYIAPRCVFQSSYGKIKIGSHCMFGPGVHIHGGNHRIHDVGKLMKQSYKKEQGDDGTVIIEDDCWIGANAIILSNVTIGTGSVVAAGAVVTKSILPYSIYSGVPAVKLRPRFTEEELAEHKKILGVGME